MSEQETLAEKSRRLTRKWKSEGRCSHCGGAVDDKRYVRCSGCRSRNNDAKKTMREKHVVSGWCAKCGRKPVEDGFLECEACSKRQYELHKKNPEVARKQREAYQREKDAAFRAYGGFCCACCGETEPLFMCIDHIEGGGEKHRRKIGVSSRGRGMYRWLRQNGYPAGFQVLCSNCNMGSSLNGGVCPHRTKSSA